MRVLEPSYRLARADPLVVVIMNSHSWEAPGPPPPEDENAGTEHPWEAEDPELGRRAWEAESADEDDPGDDNWGECSDDGEAAAETAGHMLVSLLLEHMLYSRLSTAQTCVLMYWAHLAGVSEAKLYSLRPWCTKRTLCTTDEISVRS